MLMWATVLVYECHVNMYSCIFVSLYQLGGTPTRPSTPPKRFHWDQWTSGTPTERLQLIPAGQEHILEQEDGKKRWVQMVTGLSRAFALCAASDEATAIRDDVSFFQALQAALNKQSSSNRKTPEQIDAAIRQLVSKAITTEGQVIDVFTAAGLLKPDISILSDQFLAKVRGLKHKNVVAELLEKLLKDELKVRSKRNLVQSQLFSEKLKKTLNSYHNRAISTMEVINENAGQHEMDRPSGRT
ncbi:MAG: type I restriction enzyme endonuclease domain-containing protein [Candidatus Competibacteraceae bacterium]